MKKVREDLAKAFSMLHLDKVSSQLILKNKWKIQLIYQVKMRVWFTLDKCLNALRAKLAKLKAKSVYDKNCANALKGKRKRLL